MMTEFQVKTYQILVGSIWNYNYQQYIYSILLDLADIVKRLFNAADATNHYTHISPISFHFRLLDELMDIH